MPLNNNRTASFGSEGWPELRALLPDLVRQSRAMAVTPQMQDACIAGLVTCGSARSFSLMNTPPFYQPTTTRPTGSATPAFATRCTFDRRRMRL